MSIILVNDLRQLPPIMDKLVYASEGLVKELRNSFKTVLNFDTIFHQDGPSDEKKCFHHLMMNVRYVMPTMED